MKAALPENETERLKALNHYKILDTVPEQCFDDISQLASQICGTPIAFVSFIDSDRQWFKSKIGFEALQLPRDMSLCAHTILETDLLVIPDALKDHRFADNPLVQHPPSLRFYAGAPLVTPSGEALGTLCVLDQKERRLSEAQLNALRALARQIVAQLELRVHVAAQTQHQAKLKAYQQKLEQANRQLEVVSLTDDVTGFHNTRFLHQQLDHLLAPGEAQTAVSLAFFDMDKFKSVVDTHGHLLGAQVLREVAEAINSVLAPPDRIIRYGGDEFVILLPGQDAESALTKVEQMRVQISSTTFLAAEGINLKVTASFGVATFPDDAQTKVQLLAKADQSLFRSKASGRNQVIHAGLTRYEDKLLA